MSEGIASPFDVIVVGGGVAGLTAGMFAARHGHATLIIVPLMIGGQLATIGAIEDFPGFPDGIAGYDLGPIIQEQAIAAGAQFRMVDAVGLSSNGAGWRVQTTEGALDAKAVIIATGSSARMLNVPGEERFTGQGISHCASCDGPLLKDKRIVIVGAGDAGLQEALTLTTWAQSIVILEQAARPNAQASYLKRAQDSAKIRIHCDYIVDAILGSDAIEGVQARQRRTGEITRFDADAVFVYAGLVPNTQWLRDAVELDPRGYIVTDLQMRTHRPGLFAAGDLRADSASQAITAAGDGATAAIAAHRYLQTATPGEYSPP
jgi:thioredoxin reductase (NADPH)